MIFFLSSFLEQNVSTSQHTFFKFMLVHLTERIGKNTLQKRGVNCLRLQQKCLTACGSTELNRKHTKSWGIQTLKTMVDEDVYHILRKSKRNHQCTNQ